MARLFDKHRMAEELGEDIGWVHREQRPAPTRDELLALGHKPMSAQAALRAHCLDCCAGSPHEVRLCAAVKCPSWPFRMGRNPWRAPPTEERLEAMRQRAARMRAR